VLILNALYRMAEADPSLRLRIFTGLTLQRPLYGSDLEKRFVKPLLDRLFASYPDVAYVEAQRRGALPPNIEVHEFFLQAGAALDNANVQQSYVSLNYTQVAAHLKRIGVNVLAQTVAPSFDRASATVSLAANTDVTLDMLSYVAERRARGQPIVVAGEINSNLPYMPGEAEIAAREFDVLLEPNQPHYDLFAPPKEPVSLTDYAMALQAAPWIKDGGTLQIGIGSFADALTHVLILRHTDNAAFRALIAKLGVRPSEEAGLQPFTSGLYGCSEMLVEGFLALRRAGILKRRVPVRGADGAIADSGNGPILHAGFFIGSRAFYRELRSLPPDELAQIRMTSISYINDLYGDEVLKRIQRRDARFVNTALVVTLLGAASSDQLEDGRVVGGVGGQHDFVTMAQELAGARSILAVRSRHRAGAREHSNIVWRYGNATVTRPLRDVVVSEYGVADIRGRTDQEVIIAMIEIADSAFQDGLRRQAVSAGKLAASYVVPESARSNNPARIAAALQKARRDGLLPVFPFGTDMTPTEQALVPVLRALKSATPLGLARRLLKGAWHAPTKPQQDGLERLQLAKPRSMGERALRALVLGAMRG